MPEGGGGVPRSAAERARELAAGVIRRRDGDEAAEEFLQSVVTAEQAARRTRARRAEAEAISASRVARGQGAHEDADLRPQSARRPDRESRRTGKALAEVIDERKHRKAQQKQVRTEKSEAQSLRSAFRARHARDNARASAQAEQLAAKALGQHGIKQHFRLLPKVAFFAAYMAGLDRNGVGALQALRSVNMPRRRMQQVLRAAYAPQGYCPRRDVTTGQRAEQRRYEFDGRELGGKLWQDGQRLDEHPGAIRVIQVAIFLWVAKARTRRAGHSYVVRGFGRGLFMSLCGCGKDALFGHERGVPGALRALQQAGFVNYGQPPAEKVADIDRGPSGHAYNVYWFRSDALEQALTSLHERVAELPNLPAVESVIADRKQLLTRLDALGQEPSPPAPRAQAPPGCFDEAEIPF